MRKVVAMLGSLLMMAAVLVGVSTAPAYADECTDLPWPLGEKCGQIRHFSPDDGYDDPFPIRCKYGDPSTNHELAEGQNSTRYCKDTDQVYVRANTEIWCLPTTYPGWVKRFDKRGWHKIDDIWDDGYGCTVRRD